MLFLNVISEEEEFALLYYLEKCGWDGKIGPSMSARRIQIYGPLHDSDYGHTSDEKTPFPECIKWIISLLLDRLKVLLKDSVCEKLLLPEKWNDDKMEVFVNEYLPGQGLRPHFDSRGTYDELIVGLSLYSDSKLTFTNPEFPDIDIPIPRRSVYCMHGATRYKWKHSIKYQNLTDRRVSLTFRTVRDFKKKLQIDAEQQSIDDFFKDNPLFSN